MIYKNTELHDCYDIVSDAYSGEKKMIRVLYGDRLADDLWNILTEVKYD
ncbi:hypothetical protein [uncultured Robinsoniella sp.]|mgnify:CR=1 FL=1